MAGMVVDTAAQVADPQRATALGIGHYRFTP
jgi:hypothetical protein